MNDSSNPSHETPSLQYMFLPSTTDRLPEQRQQFPAANSSLLFIPSYHQNIPQYNPLHIWGAGNTGQYWGRQQHNAYQHRDSPSNISGISHGSVRTPYLQNTSTSQTSWSGRYQQYQQGSSDSSTELPPEMSLNVNQLFRTN